MTCLITGWTCRCTDLKGQIQTISDGEFATAKREVDALRAELGQGPTPSLQQLVDDKSAVYVNLYANADASYWIDADS